MKFVPLFALSLLITQTACSRRPAVFEQAPFPEMAALTCELKAVHDGALNPDYHRNRTQDVMPLTVTALNAVAGRAQIIGNVGTADVVFRRQADQMQFFEQTPTGNPMMLSVYAPPGKGKPLPAAYSRHVLVSPGNIAISQYAGSCEPKI